MPKFVVLKTLPKGQQPGELVDLNDDEGAVFLAVEAVREARPSDDKTTTPVKTSPPRPRSREYHRRDLHAAATTD